MKRKESVFAGLLLSATAVLAQAGSWTNKAGHVLSAEPVAVKGSQVLFQQGSKTVSYPLSVFPPSEQSRLKADLGVVEVPNGLKDAHAMAQRTLKRLRVLHADGKMSDKAYSEGCAKAQRRFREQAAPFVEQGLISVQQLSQLPL